MFVATFTTVNNVNGHFDTDKNGNLPMIGTVRAGKARGTIINGSVFETQGYKANKAYLCQNTPFTAGDGTVYQNTEIIQELSLVDMISASKELGAPQLVEAVKAEAVGVEA